MIVKDPMAEEAKDGQLDPKDPANSSMETGLRRN